MTVDIRKEAARARALQNDETFKSLIGKVREEQVSFFLNSSAEMVEQREDAHAMVRALNTIEGFLQSAIDDEKMFDRNK